MLNAPTFSIPTLTCSIDQFYLRRKEQQDLAASHLSNPLVQHRGQASTHDLPLAIEVLSSLRQGLPTKIPDFDKSAFNGEGDQIAYERWQVVNEPEQKRIELVILEGWCIGFQALSDADLQQSWEDAVLQYARDGRKSPLAASQLSSIHFVNAALRSYENLLNQIDSIILLDAEDPQLVYEWRIEQEHALRKSHGSGMTDKQVIAFVDDYFPAYQLYTHALRTSPCRGDQLQLLLDRERRYAFLYPSLFSFLLCSECTHEVTTVDEFMFDQPFPCACKLSVDDLR